MCHCTPELRTPCCGKPECYAPSNNKMNYSEAVLEPKRMDVFRARTSVRNNLNRLDDKTSDQAEHYQHLINTYSDLINRIEEAIVESRELGSGI